ncbi:hypothetical protein N9200_00670 [Akkermansiaceae bacterium]|nr:hypothetical protein [Akkermansiaceae bacterium]
MLIIMQGRLRSTRLPAKGFLPFFGQTVWERMCDIALEISGENQVVFATGNLPENKIAQSVIEAKGVRFYAGSEDDVLRRFCRVAENSNAEYVVRLTCDNYLVQPDVVEGLVSEVSTADADYGYISPLSHYAGEVIRRQVLLKSWRSGSSSDMAIEHVTWDIRQDPKVSKVVLPDDYLGLCHEKSVTLDSIEDFIRMKALERDCPELKAPRCLEAVSSICE